ncbi:MAG TPA: phosphoenolpyruvate carboxykinase (GTP) [Methylomirabilota bacterium]|jgi:phosphoenolpyruvate carboxykinase (GTP)|nr:phosphoenolpyruvate carboxykinase (GTP) [Methylomirabilota bacterium]
MSGTQRVETWVDEVAGLTQPNKIAWADGSKAEYDRLIDDMLRDGTLLPLNSRTYPNCYLHRSHPSDVARTEQLTFICTGARDDAGPTNNWMAPAEGKEKVGRLLRGSMRGRTMWVIPYLMGPAGSSMSRVGVMVTDSAYVVASMHIMTRVGSVALEHMRDADDFVRGLHSLGDLSPDRRFILHFPEERLIWSVGSGYGGNALLGKKCHALRIASSQARQEGWMAEHMLILGLEDPQGRVTYLAAAMPSASGKTNLAMVVSSLPGYRVWTVGDDIAWIHVDGNGQLRATNPERGFFGVAPNTSAKTNPNGAAMVRSNTIFTNVALTPSKEPWWEGMGPEAPEGLLDWQGKPWAPGGGPAAHPNSRFTVPAQQCPSIAPNWEDPQGVPISGFIFGSRRARVVPLVFEAFDWQHGVFLGSAMGTETTAAITGKVGVVRRDPMAMIPFCGYNMADYFAHWLSFGPRLKNPPRIFRVNWFRRDEQGRFLWPGYGENVRILKWIVERIHGGGGAVETPIGYVPAPGAIDTRGLQVPPGALEAALRVDREEWGQALDELGEFYQQFGDRMPPAIWNAHAETTRRFGL